MRDTIERAICEFIDKYYGESPEDACYDIEELANAIASDLEAEKAFSSHDACDTEIV